ncbi:hypothetical protein COCSADRAFT_38119 [Bipolaris sorokiniana ND90Pr]|uniref:C3H1-type domain-containing protein n=1 Tax=Cochliobolus sativus (strain ND90Pr / ATCC 201652) TaxID=665912 RepID=M2S7V0_COCSN|nr:uncharacterized protein COCSADRAFT_38119 [Bipolaris sorokiniana ND90Pr]EMD63253.1 hypothetical protein COCSADRAFT_38119 [Bipolaris sorokiniana ND90Pr]
MAPPGPPPYTHEQITAMTSQEERIRAYAELKSYIARLKKEKEERENAQTRGYSANPYHNAFHRKRGGYGHGFANRSYHPYQRSITHKPIDATKSREASDSESPSKQPLNTTAPTNDHSTDLQNLCRTFTSAGVCSRHGCPYIHDPDRQAVCKRWFYKDACPMGEQCSLSHKASPHNAPTCLHFQAGRCANDGCRFAHIRTNPAALNCEAFGSLGYCEKGDKCAELHAHECPSFANTGTCRYGDECRLGHVRRASRMRKTTRLSSPAGSPSSNTPNRSRTPEDMVTIKDNLEQIIPKASVDHEPRQFTQQADFVPFDANQ